MKTYLLLDHASETLYVGRRREDEVKPCYRNMRVGEVRPIVEFSDEIVNGLPRFEIERET